GEETAGTATGAATAADRLGEDAVRAPPVRLDCGVVGDDDRAAVSGAATIPPEGHQTATTAASASEAPPRLGQYAARIGPACADVGIIAHGDLPAGRGAAAAAAFCPQAARIATGAALAARALCHDAARIIACRDDDRARGDIYAAAAGRRTAIASKSGE